MAEEKEQFEERTVTLKVTKKRLSDEDLIKYELQIPAQTETEEGNCGGWFLEWWESTQHWYFCRICWQGYPTQYPVKECVEAPE